MGKNMNDQKLLLGQYLDSLEEAEVKAIAGPIRPWRGGHYADFEERRTAVAEAAIKLAQEHSGSAKTRMKWTLLLEEAAQRALWRLRAQEGSSWWAGHTVNEVRLDKEGNEQSTYDSTPGSDLDPESAWLAAEETAEFRRRLVLAVPQAVAEAVAAERIPADEASAFEQTLFVRMLTRADGESLTWMTCCQMTRFDPKKASKYWKICEIRLLELVRGNAGGRG